MPSEEVAADALFAAIFEGNETLVAELLSGDEFQRATTTKTTTATTTTRTTEPTQDANRYRQRNKQTTEQPNEQQKTSTGLMC